LKVTEGTPITGTLSLEDINLTLQLINDHENLNPATITLNPQIFQYIQELQKDDN
jgi:hypothetical protein